jgi:nitric oxide reductase activation protein
MRTGKPRKILAVATDGCPNNLNAANAVIEELREVGIEVVGIGIRCEAAVALFGADNSRNIESIAELPGAIFEILSPRLAFRKAA